MASTIPQVSDDANALYTALTADVVIDLDIPEIEIPTDFPLPPQTGPAYEDIEKVKLDDLTTGSVDGTGVFDVLMRSVNAHLELQHKANRITGGDFAKVYLGAISAVQQYAVQFLLGKDQAYWTNLNAQAALQRAQTEAVRAQIDVHLGRIMLVQGQYQLVKYKLEAYAARNDYALSKMRLVEGYNGILTSENQNLLIAEQVDTQRAQTKETLVGGAPVAGILSKQKMLLDAQQLTARENLDTARASTKDTLLDGSPVGGITAVEKAFKEAQQVQMENQGLLTLEQVETQRAQTKDTLTTGGIIGGITGVDKEIKLAQRDLAKEQTDTQRAQTKETLTSGAPIAGIAAQDKLVKIAQVKLVGEQYESQRAQTRGTLSTGETVIGMIGAQTRLYEQQIVSYKRDGESKAMKMLLDTWTARKTIDEGVAVPSAIDVPAINTMMAEYRTNLDL